MGGFRSGDRRQAKAVKAVPGLLASATAGDDRFAAVVRAVPADGQLVAEALAVLAAIEIDTARRRVVTGLGGRPDGTATLGLFADIAPHLLGLFAADGALVAAGVVEVGDERPWARRTVTLAPSVVWRLLHGATGDDELPADLAEIDLPVTSAGGTRVAAVSGPDALSRQRRALEPLGGGRALVLTVGTTVERTANGDDRRIDDVPDPAVWRAVVRAATLAGAAVIVDLPGSMPVVCRRWIARARHVRWGVTSAAELPITEMPDGDWVDAVALDRMMHEPACIMRVTRQIPPQAARR